VPRREGILAEIVTRTLADVGVRQRQVSRRDLETAAATRARSRIDFTEALRRGSPGDPPRFIAEVKKASPSEGVLRADLEPEALARVYREAGAAAVSVVTEPHFFQGEDAFLSAARAGAGDLPLLRKDFHAHELQVLEAAAGEADALLLLVGVLSPTQLKDYLDIADAFALGHLAEVDTLAEAEVALRAGARVVGVNNRDLTTFRVDVRRTETVLPVLREAGVVAVSESGIGDPDTVRRLADRGVDAFLVGTALVKSDDPGAVLRRLRDAPPPPDGGVSR